jgi:PAS domain S-box-containing protein
MNNELFVSLVYNTSLLLVLVGLYSGIKFQLALPARLKDVIAGVLAGLIGVAVMANPWQLQPGVVFDVRSILLGVTGLFFGVIPAMLTVVITGAYRIYSGGAGVWAGLSVIATSAGLGLLWRRLRPGLERKGGLLELYLFGVSIHVLMLVCMLILPWPVAQEVLRRISLPVMAVYPVGTVLLCLLLIHQRKNEETAKKLRESEELYRETVEAAVDGILLGAADGTIIGANSQMQKLAGRPLEKLIGMNVLGLFSPEQRAAKPLRFELLNSGESLVNERLLLRPDGTELPVEMHSKRMPGGTYQSIYRDMTERKQAELAKEKLNGELVKAKEEMENFLYITTHDLRSPLINIQGFSQNLLKHFDDLREVLKPIALPEQTQNSVRKLAGERIPAALNFILESVRKMDRFIAALLKVSRAGRVELHPEVLDVNTVFRGASDTMRYQLEEAGAAMTVGDLPPCRADAEALGHIFINLLSNAVKYRDKSRKLDITVRGERNSPATALYTVSDNGAGIKAAVLPQIWGIYSGAQAPGEEKGEGIGLTMCKVMAENNGGRIWAGSREREGSDFFLEMPV